MDVDIVDSVDDDFLLLNFLSDVCEEDFLPDTETNIKHTCGLFKKLSSCFSRNHSSLAIFLMAHLFKHLNPPEYSHNIRIVH